MIIIFLYKFAHSFIQSFIHQTFMECLQGTRHFLEAGDEDLECDQQRSYLQGALLSAGEK